MNIKLVPENVYNLKLPLGIFANEFSIEFRLQCGESLVATVDQFIMSCLCSLMF